MWVCALQASYRASLECRHSVRIVEKRLQQGLVCFRTWRASLIHLANRLCGQLHERGVGHERSQRRVATHGLHVQPNGG